jgi:hypothetical protein
VTSPPFRDYLPHDGPPPEPASRPRSPLPGHGRVRINGSDEHLWYASWQDDDGIEDSPTGTRDQAIQAARKMPAADRVIFSEEDGGYLDLEEWLTRAR